MLFTIPKHVSQEHQLNYNLIMADINTNIFVFVNILKPSSYITHYHNIHSKILHGAHIADAFCMDFRTNSNFYQAFTAQYTLSPYTEQVTFCLLVC
jgi:hypothetical protein